MSKERSVSEKFVLCLQTRSFLSEFSRSAPVKTRLIIAVVYITWAVVKFKPEKIQASAGVEPITSAIPVQCSIKLSHQANWKLAMLCTYLRRWIVLLHSFVVSNKSESRLIYTSFSLRWKASKSYYQPIPNYNKLSNLIGYISMPYLRIYWPVKSFAIEFVIGS